MNQYSNVITERQQTEVEQHKLSATLPNLLSTC